MQRTAAFVETANGNKAGGDEACGKVLDGDEANGIAGRNEAEKDDIAVYVHFPYCKSRCPYCDFFKNLLPKSFDETALVDRYLADLATLTPLCANRQVKSVFFGGGTPSLLSPNAVAHVLEAIDAQLGLKTEAEISLEANPNSFEQEKFQAFCQVGINRLSLGVQALNKDDLRFLGRTHSVDDALRALETALQLFPKFSIDLIYARPQQMWEAWQAELDLALSFGLKHLSLYQLTLEEGTVFAKKKIELPNEKMAATLYHNTISYLREKGLERYEISNFATSKAQQSVHNLVYWQGGDYLGLGDGAHGRLRHNGRILATVNGKISEELTSQERAEELVIMGLRIKDGLAADAFFQACGREMFDFLSQDVVKELAQLQLLVYDTSHIRLTDKGFLLLDEIIRKLLS